MFASGASAPNFSLICLGSSRAIVCCTVSGLFGFNRVGEFDAIMFSDVVVIRAARPVIDFRSSIASHWPFIGITAGNSVIVIVGTERASSPVSEVLWLSRIGLTPEPYLRMTGLILGGAVGGSVGRVL